MAEEIELVPPTQELTESEKDDHLTVKRKKPMSKSLFYERQGELKERDKAREREERARERGRKGRERGEKNKERDIPIIYVCK